MCFDTVDLCARTLFDTALSHVLKATYPFVTKWHVSIMYRYTDTEKNENFKFINKQQHTNVLYPTDTVDLCVIQLDLYLPLSKHQHTISQYQNIQM